MLRGSALELGARSLAAACLKIERRIEKGSFPEGALLASFQRSLTETLTNVDRFLEEV